jgi:hypothetical protein
VPLLSSDAAEEWKAHPILSTAHQFLGATEYAPRLRPLFDGKIE